jgi:hypothetical protein
MSEAPRRRQQPTSRGFLQRARDWRWHGLTGTVLSGLGLLLAVLVSVPLIVAVARDDPPIRLGEPGRTGPFIVRVSTVQCGKRKLPADVRDYLVRIRGSLPPVRGQLCFATASFLNDSKRATCTCVGGTLYVGENEFEVAAASPPQPPYVFPNSRAKVTLIFDIPQSVEPTKLRIRFAEDDSVYYDLV